MELPMLPRKKTFKLLLFMLIMSLFPYDGLCEIKTKCYTQSSCFNKYYNQVTIDKVYGGYWKCNVFAYYHNENGDIDTTQKELLATLQFNNHGDIAEKTKYPFLNSLEERISYIYNQNGKLRECISYSPRNRKEIYSYDSLGRITQEVWIYPYKDTNIVLYLYHNDERGERREHITHELSDNTLWLKTVTYYNNDGMKVLDSCFWAYSAISKVQYENNKFISEYFIKLEDSTNSNYRKYFYKDNGLLNKKINKNSIDTLSTISFEYDDSLRKTKEIYNKHQLSHFKYFFYDDMDRVIREEYHEQEAPFICINHYEYDSLNNYKKLTTTFENTSILYSDFIYNKYNSLGKLIEKNVINTGTVDDYTLYEYNSLDQIISKKYYDYYYHLSGIKQNLNLKEEIKYAYDSQNGCYLDIIRSKYGSKDIKYIYNQLGQIIEEGEIEDGIYSRSETNDYDENGWIIKKIYYGDSTSIGRLTSMSEYFYDTNGNIIREEYEGHTNDENFTTFYKYDQYGNMIEEYTVYKNHLHNRDKRVIYEFTR